MLAIKNIVTLILVGILAGAVFPGYVKGQNCGCAASLCCGQFGFVALAPSTVASGAKKALVLPRLPRQRQVLVVFRWHVTSNFFNGIINQAATDCAGKSFYTRAAFLDALNSYDQFGKIGSADDSKREIAAFFAHVTHETGHFCHKDEINGVTHDYCDESNTQYPCSPNKNYFGRGPLQLTWNYNYGAAGKSIGFDGLNSPESVATDATLSFKTALWFWMTNVCSVVTQGFGATIRVINGDIECDDRNSGAVQARVQYYTDYCKQLGVATGDNLTC